MLTAGSKSVRFFLPLCGKAGDLLHLYNEGHTVTGVEGVPFVVEQFFRENKLDYEKVSLPEIRGWKYKVEQSRQRFPVLLQPCTPIFRQKTTGCASMLATSSLSPRR